MLVQAASLVVRDKVSDKDRREIERMMRDDVLETTRYPEVMYASANVSARATSQALYDVGINGDLTLHGVTRRCPVNAQVSLNGNTLRARGEFSLRQSDYNIKQISIALFLLSSASLRLHRCFVATMSNENFNSSLTLSVPPAMEIGLML